MNIIKDSNDLEVFFGFEEHIKTKIENIRREAYAGNNDLCVKYIKEVELEINEKYEDIRFFIPGINSVFQLFGDIYSKLNDREQALKYYYRFHFSNYEIKSPYRNKRIKLLSFRNISSYSLADLVNNEITVCSPIVMNDPFDSIALLWASPENSEKLGKGFRDTNEFFIASFKPYKIRCFTKNKIRDKNNILMWSHYADEHRGFCIEYTFTPDFIEQRNFATSAFSIFLKVDYTNDNDEILKSTRLTTQQAFASKARCWKYENEVRLIDYNPACTNNYTSLPLGNSFISAVYFGYRCSESNIRLIKQIMGDKIRYYQMKQSKGKIYTLEPVKI